VAQIIKRKAGHAKGDQETKHRGTQGTTANARENGEAKILRPDLQLSLLRLGEIFDGKEFAITFCDGDAD
jgi:hypothetical protein